MEKYVLTQNFIILLFLGRLTHAQIGTTFASKVTVAKTPDKTENKSGLVTYDTGSHGNDATVSVTLTPNKEITESCYLKVVDHEIPPKITDMVKKGVKLIQFELSIANTTENPLNQNNKYTYQSNVWSMASSKHGQALLALSFNYGVLSLTTLTFGVQKLDVELEEIPKGCVIKLNENQRTKLIEYQVVRGFKDVPETTLGPDEYVCYQVIQQQGYDAKFVDRCCHRTELGINCEEDLHNVWIMVINILLLVMKIGIFLFGPLLIPGLIYSDEFDTQKYVVKFKETLRKTIRITHLDKVDGFSPRFIMDLRGRPGFKQFRDLAKTLTKDENIPVKFKEFHISVPYRKLQVENKVHVGVINSLTRAICLCKIRQVDPCKACCTANMFWCSSCLSPFAWIRFFRIFGRVLLVICIPIPYYIRLVFYYLWEEPGYQEKKAAAARLGLYLPYDFKLLTYLSPTHPVCIVIYAIYLITAFMLCTPPQNSSFAKRFRRLVVGAFRDLHNLSWLDAIAMITSIFLWPLRKFGLAGCLLGILYWPILLPLGGLLCMIYCLPLVYLSFRMLISSRAVVIGKKDQIVKSQVARKRGHDLEKSYLSKISPQSEDDKLDEDDEDFSCKEILLQFLIGLMCIISLLAIIFMLSECICYLIEIGVFTLMGIIANAGKTLRYVTLILLIMLYSYDIFNNVNKQYQKLNSALFGDVKGRISRLSDITMLPSHLQIKQGFKSMELSQQGDYENPDQLWRKEDVSKDTTPLCWNINDLILFVDNEDLPRIPRKLFDEVCNIRVAGAPGPVYRALLRAVGQFLCIIFFLIFVFLVVMSFGDAYGVSTTNQTLATVAGGFLPYILRTFFSPKAAPLTLSTLTFKSKMDEVVKGFRQAWPIADLPFVVDDGESSETGKNIKSI